jgi:sulfhydrogenase subunit beta (sulfur reductase)
MIVNKSVLLKDQMSELITLMLTKYQVYGPVSNGVVTLFKQVGDASQLDIDYTNSSVPPKSLFFGQTETLFKFSFNPKVKIEPVNIPNERTVIFGIRPCDAKGLAILDKVFKRDYEDPFYLTKRKNHVLVGLSCNRPGVNCFCTSFDNGPASTENVDVLLTDIGEKYYVEVNSDKGEELMGGLNKLFTSAKSKDEKIRKEVEEKAVRAINRGINIEGAVDQLDKVFESPFWKTIAMKCLSCGICTYLCPTCHCFDIQDEATLTKGARVRVWDSCMFPEYTRQSSGYNPRPERMNRVRNRIYHKYNYYPKNYAMTACVGCGRCIDNCPVNIDVIDVLNTAGVAGK